MDLNEQIEEMKKIRGESYKPRTRHIDSNGRARYTNRLFLESSPYLLQHAHNPVDWRPWGDEAFEAARDLNRPVLLSVGYSTCHWCHVMEEESFEDEEVAGFINENYIAVKVDREERPDVDSIYMSAVQALTRRGGWPMTVWLTPDRAPFYGGTYFPARDGDRGVGVGFLTILEKLKAMYDGQREMVEKSSLELTGVVRKMLTPSSGSHAPGGEALARAAAYFKQRFDPAHGGAAGAPKFPATFPIRLFLRYFKRSGDAEALKMAAFTL
ncbi:MAG: thioredoxin domain-containing protein, partial [Desulfobacterales bacterium]|nr:thioredoxin domain-containing protein [Desulfobacterales bacterium]